MDSAQITLEPWTSTPCFAPSHGNLAHGEQDLNCECTDTDLL